MKTSTFYCIFIFPVMLVSQTVRPDNPALSHWMRNISEGEGAIATGLPDYASEIAVSGNTVHMIWLRDDFTGDKRYLLYRRSVDNGISWEPLHIIYENAYNDFHSSLLSKRMVVSGEDVHIVVASTDEIIYFRSRNGGVSFEDPVVLLAQQPDQVVYDMVLTASGTKISLFYMGSGVEGASIDIFNSQDGGSTFLHSLITGALDWRWWKICDAYHDGNRIYILYLYNYWQFGYTVQGDLYFGVSSDGGNYFDTQIISVPSSNGMHKTEYLQDQNYVPKLAVDGPDVYVTWPGLDYDDLMSIFVRHSPDYGVTFQQAVNITRSQPISNPALQVGQESVYARGGHVYSMFLSKDARIYVRSSSDGGASFGQLTPLNAIPETPFISTGWWPQAMIDPVDETGQTLHVLYSYPIYLTTSDGGQTFTGPVTVGPHLNWTTSTARPRIAIGEDGIIHLCTEGAFYSSGVYGDADIFYRRLEPAPQPSESQALKLETEPYTTKRFDYMAVPHSPAIQFQDKMTMECWVNPDQGSIKTARIITKENGLSFYYQPSAYQIGSHEYSGGRYTHAGIKTADGTFMNWGGALPEGQWTHLAMTYDRNAGENNFILYINGLVSVATTATGDIDQGDGMLIVGTTRDAELSTFSGMVDEIRLWNRALDQQEILQNMYTTLNGNESGLAAYYPLDGTTMDISIHGNNGYLTSLEQFVPSVITVPDMDNDGISDPEERGPGGTDLTWDGNGDGQPDWQQGQVGSLHSFSGNRYVTFASQENIPLNQVKAIESPGGVPMGYWFYYGFFEFSILLNDLPSAEVRLYLHGGPPVDNYFNYGLIPSYRDNWYEFLYDQSTGAVFHKDTINLYYIDGARGDHDLTANGMITTTGGPASPEDGIFDVAGIKRLLKQNVPNPARNETLICYQVTEAGLITLKIYDAMGNEVMEVVNAHHQPGEYNKVIRTRDLPAGIYYYQLISGHNNETRKMMMY